MRRCDVSGGGSGGALCHVFYMVYVENILLKVWPVRMWSHAREAKNASIRSCFYFTFVQQSNSLFEPS
jgi:hypothetical protein